MTVMRSSAFLKQCFEAHRGELQFRPQTGLRVQFRCAACRLAHSVALRPEGQRAPAAEAGWPAPLAPCLAEHPAAVRLQDLDLIRDRLILSCADCRHGFVFLIRDCATRSSASGTAG